MMANHFVLIHPYIQYLGKGGFSLAPKDSLPGVGPFFINTFNRHRTIVDHCSSGNRQVCCRGLNGQRSQILGILRYLSGNKYYRDSDTIRKIGNVADGDNIFIFVSSHGATIHKRKLGVFGKDYLIKTPVLQINHEGTIEWERFEGATETYTWDGYTREAYKGHPQDTKTFVFKDFDDRNFNKIPGNGSDFIEVYKPGYLQEPYKVYFPYSYCADIDGEIRPVFYDTLVNDAIGNLKKRVWYIGHVTSYLPPPEFKETNYREESSFITSDALRITSADLAPILETATTKMFFLFEVCNSGAFGNYTKDSISEWMCWDACTNDEIAWVSFVSFSAGDFTECFYSVLESGATNVPKIFDSIRKELTADISSRTSKHGTQTPQKRYQGTYWNGGWFVSGAEFPIDKAFH